MKLLIVDDCPTVRLRLSRTVVKHGFEAVIAKDAFEALNLLETGDMPRLLIVDWVMPKLEGPDLIREIRQRDPDRSIYIIMLTAKTGREVLETAFRCGADDYLSKPVNDDDLVRRISEGRNILQRHDQVMSATLKN